MPLLSVFGSAGHIYESAGLQMISMMLSEVGHLAVEHARCSRL